MGYAPQRSSYGSTVCTGVEGEFRTNKALINLLSLIPFISVRDSPHFCADGVLWQGAVETSRLVQVFAAAIMKS